MRNIFKKPFSNYACEGDTITATSGRFTLTARLYRDDCSDAPDERQDGFWPSLDPNDAGYIGPKSQRTLERHKAKAVEAMPAWRADEWFYCGVAVTVECEDVQLTAQYANAIWGIECNYPSTRKHPNEYLLTVANELAEEALTQARLKLDELQDA